MIGHTARMRETEIARLQNKKFDFAFSIPRHRIVCVQIKSDQTSNGPQIGISSGVGAQFLREVLVRCNMSNDGG